MTDTYMKVIANGVMTIHIDKVDEAGLHPVIFFLDENELSNLSVTDAKLIELKDRLATLGYHKLEDRGT